MENNKNVCENAIWWRGLNLSAWISKGTNNKLWFKYEIQKSTFLGKDKPEGQQWENQALSINKLEDLCYLKTLIRYLIAKKDDKVLQKNCYVARKIKDERDGKEIFLKCEFFRKYRDNKDNTVKETKRLILNVSELDILRDFVEYCISQIFNIKRTWERNINKKSFGSTYQDNVEHSSQEQKGEFIDEIIDDDIPF